MRRERESLSEQGMSSPGLTKNPGERVGFGGGLTGIFGWGPSHANWRAGERGEGKGRRETKKGRRKKKGERRGFLNIFKCILGPKDLKWSAKRSKIVRN